MLELLQLLKYVRRGDIFPKVEVLKDRLTAYVRICLNAERPEHNALHTAIVQ